MKAPRRTATGFTLIELLVAIAIILTLAALAVPRVMAALDFARMARAVGDLRAIGNDAMGYGAVHGTFPVLLDEIGHGTRRDPWGHPYQYLSFADLKGKGKMRKDRFLVPINTFFDLYSMGPDGQSQAPLTAKVSHDDVIWANDGGFVGRASEY